MPWEIKKFPDGFYVVKKDTGKKKNKHPYSSREAANQYLRALYSHVGTEALSK